VTSRAGVAARLEHERGLVRLRQRRPARPVVCNYVRYGLDTPTSCSGSAHGKRYYCVPKIFDPTSNHLFTTTGRHVHDVSAAPAFQALGKGSGGGDGHQQRRLLDCS